MLAVDVFRIRISSAGVKTGVSLGRTADAIIKVATLKRSMQG